MATGGIKCTGEGTAACRKMEARKIYKEAKKLINEEKRYDLALRQLREADSHYPTEKYKKRIDELLTFIDSNKNSFKNVMAQASAACTTNCEILHSGLKLKTELLEKLFVYQIEGVDWLYRKFLKTQGCILADDMGLGKTVQTIALIASLLESHSIHSVLLIAPTTLLSNWKREFCTWSSNAKVLSFSETLSHAKRLGTLFEVQQDGGVLLCTYDFCRTFCENLSTCAGRSFVWDYLILDEGHKIKNNTKTARIIHKINSKNRVLITGTPLQNNLRELWALYDFVTKGTLLGTYRTFKIKFEIPIMRGRNKDACTKEKVLGSKLAECLRKMCLPYILRRTKNQVLKDNNLAVMPEKFDWVVWIFLREPQVTAYREFLSSAYVKQLVLGESPNQALVSLLVLKKICDHPRLLSQRASEALNANSFGDIEDDKMSIENISEQLLIKESSKLSFCLYLLEKLKLDGHKILLFSQSTKMLDILQKILLQRKWKLSRLDGSVVGFKKRDGIIHAFQTDASIALCLLTSQVGGVGLTLTSADRVIIYDPCWNPATDSQAIDRAYRIGQKRDVVVYRLISCGTVEELIYIRQMFKNSVEKQIIRAEKDPTRYFFGADLRQLFEFRDSKTSETLEFIREIHGNNINYNQDISAHLHTIKSSPDVLDVHDHNVLFSKRTDEVVEDVEVNDLINDDINLARETLAKESHLKIQAIADME